MEKESPGKESMEEDHWGDWPKKAVAPKKKKKKLIYVHK
jgi:hypothetical protein